MISAGGLRLSQRVKVAILCVAVAVAGVVAIAIFRSNALRGDSAKSLRVEPSATAPGGWVATSGDTEWGWEAFLDQVGKDGGVRIWMLYPVTTVGQSPRPPVDLREDPDPGLSPIRAIDPLNKFQIPVDVVPGEYMLCRPSVAEGAELCGNLTVLDPNVAGTPSG